MRIFCPRAKHTLNYPTHTLDPTHRDVLGHCRVIEKAERGADALTVEWIMLFASFMSYKFVNLLELSSEERSRSITLATY